MLSWTLTEFETSLMRPTNAAQWSGRAATATVDTQPGPAVFHTGPETGTPATFQNRRVVRSLVCSHGGELAGVVLSIEPSRFAQNTT